MENLDNIGVGLGTILSAFEILWRLESRPESRLTKSRNLDCRRTYVNHGDSRVGSY